MKVVVYAGDVRAYPRSYTKEEDWEHDEGVLYDGCFVSPWRDGSWFLIPKESVMSGIRQKIVGSANDTLIVETDDGLQFAIYSTRNRDFRRALRGMSPINRWRAKQYR